MPSTLASHPSRWANGKGITIHEAIAANQFSIDLFKLLFSDGNVGFWAHELAHFHISLANNYARLKEREKTLLALEEGVKYSIMAVNCPKMCYTAPLVNRLTHDPENTGKNYTGNACNVFLRDLEQPYHYFGFIREDLRFQKIVEEAKKYAK